VGFDSSADIAGTYGNNFGVFNNTPGRPVPVIDTTVKASGNGSLKFTVAAGQVGSYAGQYFTNFSSNLLTQFGQNSEFYFQWRQRMSPEFVNGAGYKQIIVGLGDKPGSGCSASNSIPCAPSCVANDIVVQNTYRRGYAQMYNSCTGSASHGPYAGFEEGGDFGAGFDIKLQNARQAPYCLYSQQNTVPQTFFPPKGNCFAYVANEWMTFQVRVKVGPRVGDEFTNSFIQLWIAREGKPSEPVINWGPYNLSAGPAEQDQKYGKIWLLPYSGASVFSQTAYTWYDELIISRSRIPDPNVIKTGQTPVAPSSLMLK
jgi:hypothetical protein